ncbi:hypothetical protein BH09ACT6_BH09ACT6_11790 [soil metagenome]
MVTTAEPRSADARADPLRHLSRPEWAAAEQTHHERADALTFDWRARRLAGATHPVDDFLFTYYPYKPSVLRRWHPGAGVVLDDAADCARAEWKWHRRSGTTGVTVDVPSFFEARAATVGFIERLLGRTAARPAQFGCFGLHEWAMVYKAPAGAVRHESIPLRLSPAQTDRVVESHRVSCSHFDAVRFFTPEALSHNALSPTRENQPELEQPGCLHAGMDVYKWAIKLGPLVPGEVLLDCFELAREIRRVDMQASPYDVSEFGLDAIRIETAEGKAEYSVRQYDFAQRSNALRTRVVNAIVRARAFA